MNILVCGAGVLGSLYAARLQQVGQHVTVLARGQRLQDIRAYGIVIEDVLSRQTTTTHVNVVEELGPEDRYNLAVVVMGKHQIAAVLPQLAANRHIPSVLFLHNNAAGPQAMVEALGRERVLLGFAGAGGKREGHVIHSLLIKQQPTTLGELDGSTTPRLEQIARAFRDAGFPVAFSTHIDAALKTHAVFITCMECAVAVAGGNLELAARRDLLLLMASAVRQGFRALQARGIPIVPFNLKLMFLWMPHWFPVLYWRRALQGELGEYSLAAHAKAAAGEVRQLMAEVRALVGDTSVSTPALDQLYQDMDAISTSMRLSP